MVCASPAVVPIMTYAGQSQTLLDENHSDRGSKACMKNEPADQDGEGKHTHPWREFPRIVRFPLVRLIVHDPTL